MPLQPSNRSGIFNFVTLLLVATLAAGIETAAADYDFGRVPSGRIIEHIFEVNNNDVQSIVLSRLDLSRLIKPSVDFREILPGKSGALSIRLDTATIPDGPYRGTVTLYSDNAEPFATFSLTGEIFSPIAIEPNPVVFLTTTRGEKTTKIIELVNQTDTPFRVLELEHDKTHFSSNIETVDDGKRYRLVLSIEPDGPGGKKAAAVLIKTSHPDAPRLKLAVNTYLRERVYTFPQIIDMGVIRLSDIRRKPELVKRLAQTLMVYNKGTIDFEITANTDLKFLQLAPERGPSGDRYEISATLNPGKIKAGKIQGNIILETNDEEFNQLTVKVTGFILNE